MLFYNRLLFISHCQVSEVIFLYFKVFLPPLPSERVVVIYITSGMTCWCLCETS